MFVFLEPSEVKYGAASEQNGIIVHLIVTSIRFDVFDVDFLFFCLFPGVQI